MSARKSLEYRQCSKCNLSFLISDLPKHLNSGCSQIFCPSFGENGLNLKLAKLPSTSKLLTMPALKPKSISNSLIFLPEELMRKINAKALDWVLVRLADSNCEGNNENDVPSPGREIALRVWPIPSGGTSLCEDTTKAFLNPDGFIAHPSFAVDHTVKIFIQEEPIPISTSPSLTMCPAVKEICVEIDNSKLHLCLDEGDTKQKLCDRILTDFSGRLVSEGNVFQLKFLTDLLQFTVLRIESHSVGAKFSYYELTRKTKIKVVRSQSEIENESQRLGNGITLEDIRGVQAVGEAVCLRIKHVLANEGTDSGGQRGILIYGDHGTGKSTFVRAICNSVKIPKILYQNHPILKVALQPGEVSCKNLHEAFSEAIHRAPCAVIIEDLETLDDEDYNAMNSSARLSADLRAQFERLESLHAKVIVLATTSDLESIHPDNRSASLFGQELELRVPTAEAREDILLKINRRMKNVLAAENIKLIADSTHGFVAADLRALCEEAALFALRNRNEQNFNLEDLQVCLKTVKPSAMKGFLIEVPNVKWSDIGGGEALKFKLKQAVEWPLKYPHAFDRLGATPPKGFLMYGPPGCSKTMIAKALATESGLNFISVKGSDIFSKWVGDSEKAIQNIFRKARQVAPAIIFFDEIDALGVERGESSSSTSSVNQRVLSELLVAIEGIDKLNGVTIVGATNRPDMIDQALLRPGRLDVLVYVSLPDPATRKDIFRIIFGKMAFDASVKLNVDKYVALTDGYSGAEINGVCQEAAMKALDDDIEALDIKEGHIMAALNIVTPRISPADVELCERFANRNKNYSVRCTTATASV